MSASGPPSEPLRRDIGLIGAGVIALNGIVGAGIFALPGTLGAEFGAFSPWMILLFGLPIFLIAIPLAELGGMYERTGGPVAYAREAFGPLASFQAGWLYFIARLSAFAANITVFAAYAGPLSPLPDGAGERAALIIAAVAAIALVNIAGVKRAVAALDALSVLKIGPLIALAAAGLLLGSHALAAPTALPEFTDVEKTSLLILYAFIGFEHTLVFGGETKDAKRTIPRAMAATLAATIFLYFLVQASFVAIMGEADAGERPLAAAAEKLFGDAGTILITFAAIFSVAGNCLGAAASTPRLAYALSLDGLLPRWFSSVHERYATPANAILFYAVVALGLALTGTFKLLAVVSTLSRLIVYATSLAALPVIRAKRKSPPRRGANAVLAPAILVFGLVFCGWAILQSTLEAWRLLGALLLAGGALYAAARFFPRSGAGDGVS